MSTLTIPVGTSDPINAQILSISEDKIQGYQSDPIGRSRKSGVDTDIVSSGSPRCCAGTIRRVRQT